MSSEEIPAGHPANETIPEDGDVAVEEIIVIDGNDVLDALPKKTLAKFDPVKKVLADMEAKLKGYTPDLSTKEGEKIAREHRKNLVKVRTGAKNLYETLNAPMLQAQRETRDLVKTITSAVEKYETVIDAAIKAKESERELAAAKAKEENEARIALIRTRISNINGLPATVADFDSASIEAVIEDLGAAEINTERFGEFLQEAKDAVVDITARLKTMSGAAFSREREAEDLKRQRDELAAKQLEQEAEAAKARAATVILVKIAAIQSVPLTAIGKGLAEIEAIIDGLVAPTAEIFGDSLLQAQAAHGAAVTQLGALRSIQAGVELAASNAAAAASQAAAEAAAEQRAQPAPRQDDAFPEERQQAAADLREQRHASASELAGFTLEAQAFEKRAPEPELTVGPGDSREVDEDESNIGHGQDDTIDESTMPPSETHLECDESTSPPSPRSDAAIDAAIVAGGDALIERIGDVIVEHFIDVEKNDGSPVVGFTSSHGEIISSCAVLNLVASHYKLDLEEAAKLLRTLNFDAIQDAVNNVEVPF